MNFPVQLASKLVPQTLKSKTTQKEVSIVEPPSTDRLHNLKEELKGLNRVIHIGRKRLSKELKIYNLYFLLLIFIFI